ncbi:rRNA maturation RNase YbeY [Salinithrix halophila]|uniref:Endoribonuclease YbeY n=1 Tax=Salinithrix halophila TaxID=1485204 RepID=A0ABV8JCS1_9BACL
MNLQVDMDIQIKAEAADTSALEWVERSLDAAAKAEEINGAEVSVLITDDEEIHRLNREFRQVDRPTDVLSFPQWEAGEEWNDENGVPIPLGDLVISLPRAKEQAREYGHSLERELGFLAVHGFLHLIGYDHETVEDERAMFSRQEEILSRVGLARQE